MTSSDVELEDLEYRLSSTVLSLFKFRQRQEVSDDLLQHKFGREWSKLLFDLGLSLDW